MSSLMIEVFSFVYGTLTLAIFWFKAVTSSYGRRPKEVADLDAQTRFEQHRFWHDPSSEDEAPLLPELEHEFVTLSTGLKIHYVGSLKDDPPRTLVVLIHGFPDSWCIFHPLMSSARLAELDADIVAIDLPGFGGSDGLHDYGPDAMLNAIAETIHLLKRRYLTREGSKCIVIGHDWGGIIAYRLAAETIGLMDRACVINTAYAPLMLANAKAVDALTKSHLSVWRQAPYMFRHLLAARAASGPLRAQLLKSCYIFMLNLPFWMLRGNDITIEYLLELCHTRGNTSAGAVPPMLFETEPTSGHTQQNAIAQARAASYGPSSGECEERDARYGPSVLARSRKTERLPGDWLQRIRLYREGLAADSWQLAPHLQQYALPRDHVRATFKCPVTVLFGLRDLALDPRIVLDGIERYFQASKLINGGGPGPVSEADLSHIVDIKKAGHWPMLDSEEGLEAIVGTIYWMVEPIYGLDTALSSICAKPQDEIRVRTYGW